MSSFYLDRLTDTQVRAMICEARSTDAIAHYTTDLESGFEIPVQLGQGYWKQIQLREGLSLGVLDVVKQQPHVHQLQPDRASRLTSTFYLSGRSQVLSQQIKEDWINQINNSYVSYLPEIAGVEEFPSAERIWIVQLSMEVNIFRGFCAEQLGQLPADFQNLANSPHQPLLFQFGTLTPAIRGALQQILTCPYQGFVKRLYLESKTLELLSLQFQQAIEQVKASPQSRSLSSGDVERIHAAKDILSCRLNNPPGLVELSHLVGLNDFKLKQGFKQVYGTTVFGYLYECRMQQAQQILQAGQMNVEEVARAVGYANRSSFAVAFRRKFGTNPKEYQV
jgi:AraC family transcriptional regulator, transcriptional activator of the genes for pyochelin and ferripyochelin receptors